MQKYFNLNKNGLSLNCKLYYSSPESTKKVVLFLHGFTGNKDNRTAEQFFKKLSERDAETALLIYDAPTHGDDKSPTLTVERCMEYIKAALEYINEELKPEEIYGGGVSFGGYQTLRYLEENGNPFKKIALRSPAVGMDTVLAERIMSKEELNACRNGKTVIVKGSSTLPITKETVASFENADISDFDFTPYSDKIFIVHGDDDTLVDFAWVKAFCEKNKIEYKTVSGAGHHFAEPEKLDKSLTLMAEFFKN